MFFVLLSYRSIVSFVQIIVEVEGGNKIDFCVLEAVAVRGLGYVPTNGLREIFTVH
jgi:hypothetical protein